MRTIHPVATGRRYTFPYVLAAAAIILISGLVLPGYLQAEPKPPKPPVSTTPARKGRASIVIDGQWQFATATISKGNTDTWNSKVPVISVFVLVRIFITSGLTDGD